MKPIQIVIGENMKKMIVLVMLLILFASFGCVDEDIRKGTTISFVEGDDTEFNGDTVNIPTLDSDCEFIESDGNEKKIGNCFDVDGVKIITSSDIALKATNKPGMFDMLIEKIDEENIVISIIGLNKQTNYYKYENSYQNSVKFKTDDEGAYTFAKKIGKLEHIWIQNRPSTMYICDNDNGCDCLQWGEWNNETKTCTLTGNVFGQGSVEIQNSSITLNCEGYGIIGEGYGSGIYLIAGINGVTIQNCNITNFSTGIYLLANDNSNISSNIIENNQEGIRVEMSENIEISENVVCDNNDYQILLSEDSIGVFGTNTQCEVDDLNGGNEVSCSYTCSEVGLCDDGIDNDNDGLTDCDDPDCEEDVVCLPPACIGEIVAICSMWEDPVNCENSFEEGDTNYQCMWDYDEELCNFGNECLYEDEPFIPLSVTLIQPANETITEEDTVIVGYQPNLESNCSVYLYSYTEYIWQEICQATNVLFPTCTVGPLDNGDYYWGVVCVESSNASNIYITPEEEGFTFTINAIEEPSMCGGIEFNTCIAESGTYICQQIRDAIDNGTLAYSLEGYQCTYNIHSLECMNDYECIIEEECVIPTDGMLINESVTLCSGIYYLEGGIYINSDNIVVNCDGTVLDGSEGGASQGIRIESKRGVVLSGCTVQNYFYGIYVLSSLDNTLTNIVSLNTFRGFVLENSSNNNLIDNTACSNLENGLWEDEASVLEEANSWSLTTYDTSNVENPEYFGWVAGCEELPTCEYSPNACQEEGCNYLNLNDGMCYADESCNECIPQIPACAGNPTDFCSSLALDSYEDDCSNYYQTADGYYQCAFNGENACMILEECSYEEPPLPVCSGNAVETCEGLLGLPECLASYQSGDTNYQCSWTEDDGGYCYTSQECSYEESPTCEYSLNACPEEGCNYFNPGDGMCYADESCNECIPQIPECMGEQVPICSMWEDPVNCENSFESGEPSYQCIWNNEENYCYSGGECTYVPPIYYVYTYPIPITAGNTFGGGGYPAEAWVNIYADPVPGYGFLSWTYLDNGSVFSYQQNPGFPMPSTDVALYANFEAISDCVGVAWACGNFGDYDCFINPGCEWDNSEYCYGPEECGTFITPEECQGYYEGYCMGGVPITCAAAMYQECVNLDFCEWEGTPAEGNCYGDCSWIYASETCWGQGCEWLDVSCAWKYPECTQKPAYSYCNEMANQTDCLNREGCEWLGEETTYVTFFVDMSCEIEQGFDPNIHSVFVKDSFNWWEGIAMTPYENNIYTVSIDLSEYINYNIEYKYTYTEDIWENIDNRILFVSGEQVLDTVYFNDDNSCSIAECPAIETMMCEELSLTNPADGCNIYYRTDNGTYYICEYDGMMGCIDGEECTLEPECVPISIPDSGLLNAVCSALGEGEGCTVTDCEAGTLTTLDANDRGISDLTGIEYFTNLQHLYLSSNSISNISAVATLTNLQHLYLDSNLIYDISVLPDYINPPTQVVVIQWNCLDIYDPVTIDKVSNWEMFGVDVGGFEIQNDCRTTCDFTTECVGCEICGGEAVECLGIMDENLCIDQLYCDWKTTPGMCGRAFECSQFLEFENCDMNNCCAWNYDKGGCENIDNCASYQEEGACIADGCCENWYEGSEYCEGETLSCDSIGSEYCPNQLNCQIGGYMDENGICHTDSGCLTPCETQTCTGIGVDSCTVEGNRCNEIRQYRENEIDVYSLEGYQCEYSVVEGCHNLRACNLELECLGTPRKCDTYDANEQEGCGEQYGCEWNLAYCAGNHPLCPVMYDEPVGCDQAGFCDGAPTECLFFSGDESGCLNHGCDWGSCGNSVDCSVYPEPQCQAQPSCEWDSKNGFCYNSISCNNYGEVECLNEPSCTWTSGDENCSGHPSMCPEWTAEESCGQAGCDWFSCYWQTEYCAGDAWSCEEVAASGFDCESQEGCYLGGESECELSDDCAYVCGGIEEGYTISYSPIYIEEGNRTCDNFVGISYDLQEMPLEISNDPRNARVFDFVTGEDDVYVFCVNFVNHDGQPLENATLFMQADLGIENCEDLTTLFPEVQCHHGDLAFSANGLGEDYTFNDYGVSDVGITPAHLRYTYNIVEGTGYTHDGETCYYDSECTEECSLCVKSLYGGCLGACSYSEETGYFMSFSPVSAVDPDSGKNYDSKIVRVAYDFNVLQSAVGENRIIPTYEVVYKDDQYIPNLDGESDYYLFLLKQRQEMPPNRALPEEGVCGDGECNGSSGETSDNCPEDCYCGDGYCETTEDDVNCPEDCKVTTRTIYVSSKLDITDCEEFLDIYIGGREIVTGLTCYEGTGGPVLSANGFGEDYTTNNVFDDTFYIGEEYTNPPELVYKTDDVPAEGYFSLGNGVCYEDSNCEQTCTYCDNKRICGFEITDTETGTTYEVITDHVCGNGTRSTHPFSFENVCAIPTIPLFHCSNIGGFYYYEWGVDNYFVVDYTDSANYYMQLSGGMFNSLLTARPNSFCIVDLGEDECDLYDGEFVNLSEEGYANMNAYSCDCSPCISHENCIGECGYTYENESYISSLSPVQIESRMCNGTSLTGEPLTVFMYGLEGEIEMIMYDNQTLEGINSDLNYTVMCLDFPNEEIGWGYCEGEELGCRDNNNRTDCEEAFGGTCEWNRTGPPYLASNSILELPDKICNAEGTNQVAFLGLHEGDMFLQTVDSDDTALSLFLANGTQNFHLFCVDISLTGGPDNITMYISEETGLTNCSAIDGMGLTCYADMGIVFSPNGYGNAYTTNDIFNATHKIADGYSEPYLVRASEYESFYENITAYIQSDTGVQTCAELNALLPEIPCHVDAGGQPVLIGQGAGNDFLFNDVFNETFKVIEGYEEPYINYEADAIPLPCYSNDEGITCYRDDTCSNLLNPEIVSISIEPSTPYDDEDFTCSVITRYNEQENLLVKYWWTVNEEREVTNGYGIINEKVCPVNGECELSTVSSEHTGSGEEWTCFAYADDGEGHISSTESISTVVQPRGTGFCGDEVLEGEEECEIGYPCPSGYTCRMTDCKCVAVGSGGSGGGVIPRERAKLYARVGTSCADQQTDITIYDQVTGAPIEGVSIIIGTTNIGVTDSRGKVPYTFNIGTYAISASKTWYDSYGQSFTFINCTPVVDPVCECTQNENCATDQYCDGCYCKDINCPRGTIPIEHICVPQCECENDENCPFAYYCDGCVCQFVYDIDPKDVDLTDEDRDLLKELLDELENLLNDPSLTNEEKLKILEIKDIVLERLRNIENDAELGRLRVQTAQAIELLKQGEYEQAKQRLERTDMIRDDEIWMLFLALVILLIAATYYMLKNKKSKTLEKRSKKRIEKKAVKRKPKKQVKKKIKKPTKKKR